MTYADSRAGCGREQVVTQFNARLRSIDRRTLTPLVRAALGRSNANVTDWSFQQIHRGIGDFGAVELGVARSSGVEHNGDDHLPWSLILKVLPAAAQVEDLYEKAGRLKANQPVVLPT